MEADDVKNEVIVEEKKPKKRGRKPKPGSDKNYFGEREELAFQKYIVSTDQKERNTLFSEILYPAFSKMVESIIRRYNLFTPYEDFDDTFYDTLSFLITKVNNFDVTKKKKAYSYCGMICKNYLMLKRTQSMKKMVRNLSYDVVFPQVEKDDRIEDTHTIETMLFNNELIENTISDIQQMLLPENINNLNANEQKIGYALLEMLMNYDNIFKRVETEKFNKTSVSYFIKEYTRLNTAEIRKGMKKFKGIYAIAKKNLIEG